MLKIAVVSRYFPSSAEPWGGRSAYQVLRILARTNEVRVFYPNAVYPKLLKPRSRHFNRLDSEYRPPDVEVDYYEFPALPAISRPLNGWMAGRSLLPYVREFAPDIILSYYLYPYGYAAMQIAKALRVPVVIETIGSDLNNIGDPISAVHTRKVLREADFLMTVSHDLCRKAVAMGARPDSTRAVLNGSDPEVFHVRDRIEARNRLGVDPSAEVVVYIGRMDVKKGIRELFEAARKLHPARPKLQVYMVGDGPDKPLIEEAVRAANAGAYVQLKKSCSFDDVAVWMAASDLITLPSYMEGCPNVVVEALACGRPVVATHVGGIPEIMDEHCGRLVAPRRSDELAEALASVLETRWDAEAISARWSRPWSAVAADMSEIFDRVMEKQRATCNAG